MCLIDQACELENIAREEALARHRAAMPSGESATHCEDCEQPIPEARREKARGCVRCVTCQTVYEHPHG